MSEPIALNILRPRLDDDPIGLGITLDGSIAGYTFLLTIKEVGTIAGAITDATAGEFEFDPTNGLDLVAAPLNITELAVGTYTYYVVMTTPSGDERTICEGRWTVRERGG